MKNRTKIVCGLFALVLSAGCVEDRIIQLDRTEIAKLDAAIWLRALGLNVGKTIVKPDWPERD